jgi:hypothetical protein
MEILYRELSESLKKANGRIEWEGYSRARGAKENDILSFVYAVSDSASKVLQNFEESEGIKFFYEGLPTKEAIKMCTLLANKTAYAVGSTMDWEDYDESITFERTYVTPDYVKALKMLDPLLETGHALLLPKTVSDHEMFEDTKTKQYVLTKDILHTRYEKYPDIFRFDNVTEDSSKILLPFPYLHSADFRSISDIRKDNENLFNEFQNQLLRLVRRDPSELGNSDVQLIVERLGQAILELCEQQKKLESELKWKGLEIHLLFGVAAINVVLPPPLSNLISLLGLIYNLPTIKDLKVWYKKWAIRKSDFTGNTGGLEFLWLAEDTINR